MTSDFSSGIAVAVMAAAPIQRGVDLGDLLGQLGLEALQFGLQPGDLVLGRVDAFLGGLRACRGARRRGRACRGRCCVDLPAEQPAEDRPGGATAARRACRGALLLSATSIRSSAAAIWSRSFVTFFSYLSAASRSRRRRPVVGRLQAARSNCSAVSPGRPNILSSVLAGISTDRLRDRCRRGRSRAAQNVALGDRPSVRRYAHGAGGSAAQVAVVVVDGDRRGRDVDVAERGKHALVLLVVDEVGLRLVVAQVTRATTAAADGAAGSPPTVASQGAATSTHRTGDAVGDLGHHRRLVVGESAGGRGRRRWRGSGAPATVGASGAGAGAAAAGVVPPRVSELIWSRVIGPRR